MIRTRLVLGALALVAVITAPLLQAAAQEDSSGMGPTFKEGDIITYDNADALRPFLPEEFWNNRDFFFYEGMQLEVGPFHRDYTPAEAYMKATEQYRGQARIGPDNSLENYTAGRPFPNDTIDCASDPQAGVKIMWNFDYVWGGAGATTTFYYSYWDRGEELPLYYEGNSTRCERTTDFELPS